MKVIKQTANENHWPRMQVKQIKCRKRDLVIRVANWMKDKDEPAYDVEVYIGGIYDNDESHTFTLSSGLTRQDAKTRAIQYASKQIAKLL